MVDANSGRWSVSPQDAWRLLTEPMSQDEAHTAAAAVHQALPHVTAFSIDPHEYLLLAWDREAVETIHEALLAHGDERAVSQRLAGTLAQWLATATPTDPEQGDQESYPLI